MVGLYVRWAPWLYLPLFALFIAAAVLVGNWGGVIFLLVMLGLNVLLWWLARRWHREAHS